MKKLVFPFLLMVALFAVTGCSEKFNVAAPYKDITVIYAFLDRADTAHYVRVQKAFLDQNKNALDMSKNPDSSFYANLNVRIERISFSDTAHIADTIHLNRVDLNLEGYPKEAGVFFNSPNYAYKFTNDLNPEYLYRIVVTNLTTGKSDSATAPVIDDVTAGAIHVDLLDDNGPNFKFDFSDPISQLPEEINFNYVPVNDFTFQGVNTPVYITYPIFRFNWADSDITTHVKITRSYDFVLGQMTTTNNANDYKIKNSEFYSALATGMSKAPTNTVRLIDRCDVICYLSTRDYYTYQQSQLTKGVGLTGNEIEPTYTNIQGADALGLFTARAMRSGKVTLSDETISGLMSNSQLSTARIVGTVYH